MKIWDLLVKLTGSGITDLKKILQSVADQGGDLAAPAAALLQLLDSAPSAQALAEVGASIPGELLNVVQGKIESRDHAGDGA